MGVCLLQIAVDRIEDFAVLPGVVEFADIVEVGTPVLKRLGVTAIELTKAMAQGKPILVDSKVVDGGEVEAEMVFGANVRYITVLACASDATFSAIGEVASAHDGIGVVDTICGCSLAEICGRLDGLASCFQYIVVHASSDSRRAGGSLESALGIGRELRSAGYEVAFAGGVSEENVDLVLEIGPSIVVVGGAIMRAKRPWEVAGWMRKRLERAVA